MIGAGIIILVTLTRHGSAEDTNGGKSRGPRQPADKIAVERFIADYAEPSERLKKALENIECAYSVEAKWSNGAKGPSFVGKFYAKGESREDVRAAPDAKVVCLSADSAFELKRPADAADYAIARFRSPPTEGIRNQIGQNMRANVNPFLRATVQMFDVPIDELIARDDIQKSFAKSEEGGHTYVDGDFRFPEGTTRGAVRFDPDLDYAVIRYSVEMNVPGDTPIKITRDGTVQCERRQDGYIVPKSVRLVSGSVGAKEGDNAVTSDVRLSGISIGNVDDAQFTIAAFGLPDVSLARGPSWHPLNKWYFWALIGIAGGGALYYRRNRRNQSRVAGNQ